MWEYSSENLWKCILTLADDTSGEKNETVIRTANLIELLQIVLDRGAVLDGTHCISKLEPGILSIVLC